MRIHAVLLYCNAPSHFAVLSLAYTAEFCRCQRKPFVCRKHRSQTFVAYDKTSVAMVITNLLLLHKGSVIASSRGGGGRHLGGGTKILHTQRAGG